MPVYQRLQHPQPGPAHIGHHSRFRSAGADPLPDPLGRALQAAQPHHQEHILQGGSILPQDLPVRPGGSRLHLLGPAQRLEIQHLAEKDPRA